MVAPHTLLTEYASKLMISSQVGHGGQPRLDAVATDIDGLSGEKQRCMETCWILLTQMSARKVRDSLKQHLATGDRLMVGVLSGHAIWHGFPAQEDDWLLARL